MTISILGTEYTVTVKDRNDDVKLSEKDGYTDFSIKQIVVCNVVKEKNYTEDMEDLTIYMQKVLRHETIHALFYESGMDEMCDLARNEMLVDWIALQIPKLIDEWKELKAL